MPTHYFQYNIHNKIFLNKVIIYRGYTSRPDQHIRSYTTLGCYICFLLNILDCAVLLDYTLQRSINK